MPVQQRIEVHWVARCEVCNVTPNKSEMKSFMERTKWPSWFLLLLTTSWYTITYLQVLWNCAERSTGWWILWIPYGSWHALRGTHQSAISLSPFSFSHCPPLEGGWIVGGNTPGIPEQMFHWFAPEDWREHLGNATAATHVNNIKIKSVLVRRSVSA